MRTGPDQNDALLQGLDLDHDVARSPMEPTAPPRDADGTDLPAFPIDVIPARIVTILTAFAAAVDASIDLIMPAAFGVLATALGPRWLVGAQSFVRSPLLWFALVAPSGSAKSPAARPVIEPLRKRHTELRKVYEAAVASYDAEMASRKAAKPKERAALGPEPKQPVRTCAVLTDVTPEGLVFNLQYAPDGIFVHSDELAQLLHSLDAYHTRPGKGRTVFLRLWSGDSISEGRKVAHSSEVDDPFAILYGGIQPSRLDKLELADGDGLTGRFLWATPEVQAGGLGREVSILHTDAWQRIIQRALGHPDLGVQGFTADAAALLDQRLRTWKQRAIDLDKAGAGLLSSFYGKAGEYAVRLTALLHGIDALAEALEQAERAGSTSPVHTDEPLPELKANPVSAATFRRALRLVDYYLAHGEVVVARVLSPPEDSAAPAEKSPPIADGLLEVLGEGQSITDTPAAWVERLQEVGLNLNPSELGRAMVRLQEKRHPGLVVERPVRGSARNWTVRRIEATEATEATNTPIEGPDRDLSGAVASEGSDGSDGDGPEGVHAEASA